MEIERIIKIIEKLDDLSNKFSDNEVIMACYLSIRYGTHTCKYYIDNTDLDKIHKEIRLIKTVAPIMRLTAIEDTN